MSERKRLLKDIVTSARIQGWKVTQTGNNHLKLIPPDKTKSLIQTGGTPTDHRAIKNLLSQMKRTGCFKWEK